MMPEDIVVVGAGGFGRETLDVIEAINAQAAQPKWRVVGIADDSPAPVHRERLEVRGYSLLGSVRAVIHSTTPSQYVVAIGNPKIRALIAAQFERAGWVSPSLIHPRAVVGSHSPATAGVVVCSGAQVSTNVTLGRYVHLNPGAIVGHDTALHEFVSVNPGAVVSGDVTVEALTLVGAGAVVLQGLTVGAASTVGAAACVVKDVAANSTVVGVPARVISHKEPR